MGRTISIDENRITINETDLSIRVAVGLMQNLIDMYPLCKGKVILDVKGVKHFSPSSLLIINRLMDEYDGLSLEANQVSAIEKKQSRNAVTPSA